MSFATRFGLSIFWIFCIGGGIVHLCTEVQHTVPLIVAQADQHVRQTDFTEARLFPFPCCNGGRDAGI